MTANSKSLQNHQDLSEETELEGIYGRYRITLADKEEVKRYRISVLICAISFCAGLGHWLLIGPTWAWLWLISMAISLGLALKWIHIYLRPLHRSLQIFWAIGCLGIVILIVNIGAEKVLINIAMEPKLTLIIGPFFAAITGLGFKEFFCFRRPEAIGLTGLIPLALIGHLTGFIQGGIVMTLLFLSSLLMILLATRKFGMDAAADVGDKSIFEYLDNQKTADAL